MKRKLVKALSLFMLILLGAGFCSILLLNETTSRYTELNLVRYTEIRALQKLRSNTVRINSHYLGPLISGEPLRREEFDPMVFEMNRKEMENALDVVRSFEKARETPEFRLLEESIDRFFAEYKTLLNGPDLELTILRSTGRRIAQLTPQLTESADSLIDVLERSFESTHTDLNKNSLKSGWLIGLLMLLGFGLAVWAYHYTKRSLVDPIVRLTKSLEQIQQGDFELDLPTSSSKDEVAALIPAFNKMVGELRQMRRATDKELLKIDLQNRAILASFPYPIILLDEKGNVEKLNPQAVELHSNLGLLSGLPTNVAAKVEQAITSGQPYLPDKLSEALLLRIAEEEHFFLPRIFALHTLDQQSQGWVVVLSNVTPLRFADDLKSNLISTISHEIKTPLTGIRMVLHLLLEEKTGDLTELQKEMLGSAHNDCERLLKTLRSLLEMSRIDSGASSLDKIELDCGLLLAETAVLFEGIAQEKDLTFIFEIEENLPPALADHVRIMEVINNFVSNAIKHSPEGEQITLRAAREGADYVRISVIDRGAGVAEDSRSRIFERFYRAPNQPNTDGVGLGLSISREIIIAHEGRIGHLQDTPGETHFYFDLPQA